MDEKPSAQDAINAALAHDWKRAISINKTLLKDAKEDLDTLNRLGYAYLKSGDFKKAKTQFNKVIKLDQYNHIAQRHLGKLSQVKKKDIKDGNEEMVSPMTFLEEPGKTKLTPCINLAPAKVLSRVTPGAHVDLKPKKRSIEIRDAANVYLGELPDDLAFRIMKFLEGGNTYQSVVKSVGEKELIVFIREMSRGKRFASQPSFTHTTSYTPFAHGTPRKPMKIEKPDVTPTGEGKD